MQAEGEAGPPPPPPPDLPPALASCPPAELEAFARARIERFAAALQQRLAAGLGPEQAAAAAEAARQLLAEADHGGMRSSGSGDSETLPLAAPDGAGGAAAVAAGPVVPPPAPTTTVLRFAHDCRHSGCADAQCKLCEQNPERRCARALAPKYLTGDVLRAACGAPIRVELSDRATGRPVQEHAPLLLQLSVLDGRAYEELAAAAAAAGGAPAERDLQRIVLLRNQQGRPLLTSKQGGGAGEDGRVSIELAGGSALLPDLCVTGSSEALLSGQRPPFALLVLAFEGGGGGGQDGGGDGQEGGGGPRRRADVPPAVSDCFVVATPRVRSAAKRDVPLLTDHVSKLNCVGTATQAKLRDLKKAAVDAGERGLALPLAAVTTVAEFRELAGWAAGDAGRLDRVKRLLKLTRGWEEARDHALRAVGSDTRLRAFFADDSRSRGLLFAARDACPLADAPLAVLEAATGADGAPTLRATLLPHGSCEQQPAEGGSIADGAGDGASPDAQQVAALMQQAKACWGRRGHPGWALLPLETAAFQQGCSHLPSVLLPVQLAAAAVPQVPHSGPAFPPPPAAPASPSLASPALGDQQQQQQQLMAAAATAGTAAGAASAGLAAGSLAHKLALSLALQSPGRGSPAPMQFGGPQAGTGGPLALTPVGSVDTEVPLLPQPMLITSQPQVGASLAAERAGGSPPLFVFGTHWAAAAAGAEPSTPHMPGGVHGGLGGRQQAAGGAALGIDPSSAPGALARILTSLPSLPSFGPEGALGLPAIAELDLAAGLQPDARQLPHTTSLGGLSDASVDWKQLLREAYGTPGGGTPLLPSGHTTPQPCEEAGPASGSATPPLISPAAAPTAAAATAAGATAAAAAAAAAGGSSAGGGGGGGGQLGSALLRMLSEVSLGGVGGGSRLGTLASMDWEALGLTSEGSLPGLEALLGPPAGGEGPPADAGGEGAGSLSRRRLDSPEWGRLFSSMGPADWAALLQEHQAVMGGAGAGEAAAATAAAAGSAAPPAAGSVPAVEDAQQAAVPSPPPPPKGPRKRTLGAGSGGGGAAGGMQGMEGVEVETPRRSG